MRRLKHLEKLFPSLATTYYEKHSNGTGLYNCIGYSHGDTRHWWDHNSWWPDNCVPGPLLDDMIKMYMAQGFETCTDGEYEANYEKVAIYSKIDAQTYDDEWTHAARLRPDGWWESKVGKSEDIIHRTATVFIGNEYGTKIIYMKRLIALRLKRQLHYLKVPEQGISFVGIRP